MSKYKKVFPKPVPRLTEASSKLLGKNSNTMSYVNKISIYNNQVVVKSNINDLQLKQLIKHRRNLGLL
jgi:hypothetical protein